MPVDLYPGFMRDICEHPHDDAPRLILADWLEDQGAVKHAQFIRLQIAGHAQDANKILYAPMVGHPRWQLWAGKPLQRVLMFTWGTKIEYRRGFIECVICAREAWEFSGKQIVLSQPVTRLRFAGPYDDCDEESSAVALTSARKEAGLPPFP